jgi:serine/threonine protein kinase/Tfp pilus assembly protein PilF
MGVVYRARQRVPSRVVALKMILPSHVDSPGAIARFRAEAEAVASLDHEGILPVYAVGEKDGAPFYSMKFAEGGNLSARIGDFENSPRKSALLITALARAVGHAHDRGILHRDLKPGNVLFGADDKPFVSDFGLAKWLERECDLTQTLAILGTPFYMAPEQAAGGNSLTGAADIYSLGAILFHVLTGRPPFRGDNAMEVLRKAAEQSPPRPRDLNHRIPPDLEIICLKCLEKDPSARYKSAAALADDLDRFVAGRPILARRAGPVKHFLRWTKRNPVIATLGAAFVCVLALLFFVARPGQRDIAIAQRSIAVLPFENVSGDNENSFLTSGIHDDVLVNLSKIADLKVISRSSVMPYKGGAHNVREIGKSLGVTAVLEGSVHHSGNRARINVQLVDAKSETQIWAQNYDREITDVFALQTDLALQIASALKAKLSTAEAERLKHAPTQNGDAYLLYIQANDLFDNYSKGRAELEKAEQLYQEAIKLDPSFALAYAQLSHVETIFNSAYEPDPSRREKARAAAREALRLQPDLPEAHMALAFDFYKGGVHDGTSDYKRALAELQIARRGLPNNAEIYSSIGRIKRFEGNFAEALAYLEKAVSLDPNNAERWDRIFYTHELMRNYPEAAKALDRAIALIPNNWNLEFHRAQLYVFWKGDLSGLEHLRAPTGNSPENWHTADRFFAKLWLRKYDEAERIVLADPREILEPSQPKTLLLGYLYLAKGDKTKAGDFFEATRPLLERRVQDKPFTAEAHADLADVYAGLGRKEDAVREAKRAAEIIPESYNVQVGRGYQIELAKIYAMVGELDQALPLVEHLLSVPAGLYVESLRFDPDWQPARSDPRFQKLIEKYTRQQKSGSEAALKTGT